MTAILFGAWVIGRREYLAVIRSKAFLLFLAGPLFPFVFGNLFDSNLTRGQGLLGLTEIQVSGDAPSMHSWAIARERVASILGSETVPRLVQRAVMEQGEPTLTGDVSHPVLIAPKGMETKLQAKIGPILYDAYLNQRQGNVFSPAPTLTIHTNPAVASQADRTLAAHAAQLGLFILTMLLSGILLSSLVEEKTTKMLDVLAAAVPIDAIFFGKLSAMLGVAMTGLLFWGSALAVYINLIASEFIIPQPAIGWTAFSVLSIIYAASIILLFGAVYLGVGAQADTSRDVQAIATPLTIAQILVFALASSALSNLNGNFGILAAAFPWSSPFAMIGQAFLSGALWPHILALVWQGIVIIATVKLGSLAFRISVMKQNGVTWFTRAQRNVSIFGI